jgi:hypothetical protein
LDIFFYKNWCYPNCKHCIATVFWFQTITVIVPLQKFKNNLAKELLRTITVTVPLVYPDYRPMLLSQEKLKNPKFSQKLRYPPETELINNFLRKSLFRFDCKNTTFCEHHKYKQWIPNWLMLWPHEKHLSGVISNLEHFPLTQ